MDKFTAQPLTNMALRKAGLATSAGALFGPTRTGKNGAKRNHQGIDLASDNGYRVYAVEDAEVVFAGETVDYGKQVLLYAPRLNVYVFYAHLKRIDVGFGWRVVSWQQIGLTGDTGNAKGMTTVDNGGHLHLEVRTVKVPGRGLAGRVDPFPYLTFA